MVQVFCLGDVLVRGVGGVCGMCLARAVWVERGLIGCENWFGPYQSCEDRGSVGHVSVFWLR